MPRIHLVTYATPRFRHRQILLGASARVNRVVDTVTSWTPRKLLKAGFEDRCKDIKLTERGSGFWAWKPFIIDAKLHEVPDGDLVFYCDVGRGYPFKQLTGTIHVFLEWMARNGQEMLPGVRIPWKGPMSLWTKRDAFVLTGMNSPEAHVAIPVQASFSVWKAGTASRDFVREWMDFASQRALISDDPSGCGVVELHDFHDHRHDQSLLTLCCLKHAIKGLDLGAEMPPFDTQHPSDVARWMSSGRSEQATVAGQFLRAAVWPIETIEARLRRNVSFGEPIPGPSVSS